MVVLVVAVEAIVVLVVVLVVVVVVVVIADMATVGIAILVVATCISGCIAFFVFCTIFSSCLDSKLSSKPALNISRSWSEQPGLEFESINEAGPIFWCSALPFPLATPVALASRVSP